MSYRRPQSAPPADPWAGVWKAQLTRWLVREYAVHPNQLCLNDRHILFDTLEACRRGKTIPVQKAMGDVAELFLLMLKAYPVLQAEAHDHQEWRRRCRARKGGGS